MRLCEIPARKKGKCFDGASLSLITDLLTCSSFYETRVTESVPPRSVIVDDEDCAKLTVNDTLGEASLKGSFKHNLDGVSFYTENFM